MSAAVRRTLSEITSTCQKAARGAGCPWGLAEEAGIAARVLAMHGLPGPETVARLLRTPRACPCDGRVTAPACGIAAAARLSDRIGALDGDETTLEATAGTLLLAAPLLLEAAQGGGGFTLTCDGVTLACGPGGVQVAAAPGDWPSAAHRITLRRSAPPDAAIPATWTSREIDGESWQRLEALAARTLVPDSDSSRAAGAGPGGADTD